MSQLDPGSNPTCAADPPTIFASISPSIQRRFGEDWRVESADSCNEKRAQLPEVSLALVVVGPVVVRTPEFRLHFHSQSSQLCPAREAKTCLPLSPSPCLLGLGQGKDLLRACLSFGPGHREEATGNSTSRLRRATGPTTVPGGENE